MTITSTTYHQIENRIVRLLNEAKKERTNALLAELKELESTSISPSPSQEIQSLMNFLEDRLILLRNEKDKQIDKVHKASQELMAHCDTEFNSLGDLLVKVAASIGTTIEDLASTFYLNLESLNTIIRHSNRIADLPVQFCANLMEITGVKFQKAVELLSTEDDYFFKSKARDAKRDYELLIEGTVISDFTVDGGVPSTRKSLGDFVLELKEYLSEIGREELLR